MNFAQLRDETTRLLKLEGFYDNNPPPDVASLVNEGLSLFSWEAEYIYATTTLTSVGGQAEYTLPGPPDWKLVQDCWFGANLPLERQSVDEVRVRDANWINAPGTIPDAHFMSGLNTLRLYPPPSQAGVVIKVFGVTADTDLAADDDSPKCPTRYHRAIPRLAAWNYAEAFAQGEAYSRIQGYYANAMAQASDLKLWIASQNVRGLQRTVRRRGVSRTFLTGEDTTVKSV